MPMDLATQLNLATEDITDLAMGGWPHINNCRVVGVFFKCDLIWAVHEIG